MTFRLAILGLTLAGLAGAQSPPRATFSSQGITVTGVVKSGVPIPNGGQRVTLGGGVSLAYPKQGVTAQSTGMVVTFGGSGGQGLRRADFSGGVTVTRRRTDQVSVLTGSAGSYVVTSSGGEIDLSGPVTITNKGADGRSMIAKGRSGRATLGSSSGGGAAIRSAVLENDVEISVNIASTGGSKSRPSGKYLVKGSRAVMDFRPSGSASTVRVTGRVSVKADSTSGSMNMPSLSAFVMNLNDRGEATSISFQGAGS